MNIKEQIINKIKRNRISTTEVADCMGKCGAMPGIKSINMGHFRVGEIYYTYANDSSNWNLHKLVRDVKENSIVLVETFDCDNRGVFGELVSKYILLYKQAAAIVIDGYMRDGARLIKENYPIWTRGFSPVGCFNKEVPELNNILLNERLNNFEDAIAVCDDAGVVIITKDFINEDFLTHLDFIELQEDIWFHCIDTKKWDTFDTVCLKKYTENLDLLPIELRNQFKEFIENQ